LKTMRAAVNKKTAALKSCVLFEEIEDQALSTLAEKGRLLRWQRGEVLFHAGAPAEGFHIVLSGRVKVCRYGADGREQVLHIFGAGEPCGEVPVFEGGVYPGAVEALEAVETLYLPRDGFLEAGRTHPEVLLRMLAVLSRRLRGFVNLIDDLSLKEVSARLARYLLTLSDEAGGAGAVEIDSSKGMLASRLGTIAETLSRTLARMQKEGLIDFNGRKVAIEDRERLEDLARGGRP
jgi:CRP/FNR family transcriptional regulator, dissimilatory nitrate respiration regulator